MSSNDPSFWGGGCGCHPPGPPPGPGLGEWQLLSCADTVRAPWTWVWWCQGLSGMVGECSCPQGAEGRETEAGGLQKWLQMSGTALFSTGGTPTPLPSKSWCGHPREQQEQQEQQLLSLEASLEISEPTSHVPLPDPSTHPATPALGQAP